MKYVIYGAQGVALGAYNSIMKMFPNAEIMCFLVTRIGNNKNNLIGVPVYELEEFSNKCSENEKESIQILISTPENFMSEIEESLENHGFYNHVRLNSSRWAEMQRNAFSFDEKFRPLQVYTVGFTRPEIHVYKAKFYKDRILSTKSLDAEYVMPIQVGAANTNKRVADILDNSGDNISEKNGNYSELTGLYWVWKNRIKDKFFGNDCYYGLFHYRRFLDVSDDDLLRLTDNDIDVLLPYPMPYEPNIEEHHKRYLSDTEWNAVIQTIDELQPTYKEQLLSILGQEYFYNYNIIIAKQDVLDRYCEWLFPLLFRIEEINNPNGNKEPNRYIGYVGETLETLYFMYNKDKLKIAHAGYRFLV